MTTVVAAPTVTAPPTRPNQYSRMAVLAIWAAAALPMAVLAWVVALWLAGRLDGPAARARALLVSMTAGLVWQFVLVLLLVYRERGSLCWPVLTDALWLRPAATCRHSWGRPRAGTSARGGGPANPRRAAEPRFPQFLEQRARQNLTVARPDPSGLAKSACSMLQRVDRVRRPPQGPAHQYRHISAGRIDRGDPLSQGSRLARPCVRYRSGGRGRGGGPGARLRGAPGARSRRVRTARRVRSAVRGRRGVPDCPCLVAR